MNQIDYNNATIGKAITIPIGMDNHIILIDVSNFLKKRNSTPTNHNTKIRKNNGATKVLSV